MNDDFFDDGFDDGDFEDNSDGDFYDDGLNAEMQDDSEQEDNGIDIGWEEIAMFGALSEEFSEDERVRRKLEKKMDTDQNNRDREDGI